ncbi:MAG: hypothetical protein EZS28_015696 [Streblomastix strix]|uniref:Uncharacterized protein n=1 Tax=Streblomastix strix TaxID=222440 RepID=A0A5J4W1F7_9EUKA|nr:MAG: hypothetical protein EZS28_015696 [Streblomastix strix]
MVGLQVHRKDLFQLQLLSESTYCAKNDCQFSQVTGFQDSALFPDSSALELDFDIIEQQSQIITPKWEEQYWWLLLQQLTVSSLNLGQAVQILKNGTIIKKGGWALPPGELIASLISGKKEENMEKACSVKQ